MRLPERLSEAAPSITPNISRRVALLQLVTTLGTSLMLMPKQPSNENISGEEKMEQEEKGIELTELLDGASLLNGKTYCMSVIDPSECARNVRFSSCSIFSSPEIFSFEG